MCFRWKDRPINDWIDLDSSKTDRDIYGSQVYYRDSITIQWRKSGLFMRVPLVSHKEKFKFGSLSHTLCNINSIWIKNINWK